jgi:D-proline reductase (dithiol) PrdD
VRGGGYKIALVKLVPGLGCLYDTLLFPSEPAGYAGGKSIIDLSNNIQVLISPNEYRDGGVHSLT